MSGEDVELPQAALLNGDNHTSDHTHVEEEEEMTVEVFRACADPGKPSSDTQSQTLEVSQSPHTHHSRASADVACPT